MMRQVRGRDEWTPDLRDAEPRVCSGELGEVGTNEIKMLTMLPTALLNN
jgi:hypothetical protein